MAYVNPEPKEPLPDGMKRIRYSYRVRGEMIVPEDVPDDFDGLMEWLGTVVVKPEGVSLRLFPTTFDDMKRTFEIEEDAKWENFVP